MMPASAGAAPLVPPIATQPPSAASYMEKPVLGSASRETSGTPRWALPVCQLGSGKMLLKPPPLAPNPLLQALSVCGLPNASGARLVPPTPVTYGSLGGHSVEVVPFPQPSEPLSPLATRSGTVTVDRSVSRPWMSLGDTCDSQATQLTEMTSGL